MDIWRGGSWLFVCYLRQCQGKRDAPDAEKYQPEKSLKERQIPHVYMSCIIYRSPGGGLATAGTQRIENGTMAIQAYQYLA